MTEVFGMQVNLKLNVENLKQVTDNVKKSLGNIPAKIKEQTSGITSGIQTGIFGESMTGGSGSLLGKMVGKLALISGVLFVIKQGVMTIVGSLAKSSPYLAGILKIFERSFMIFLRPFGDFLATLLRPLAMWLLKASIKWLNFTRTPVGKETTKTLTEGLMFGGPQGIGIMAGIDLIKNIDWDSVWQQIKGFKKGITEGVKNFGDTFKRGWENFTKNLSEILSGIKDKISSVWSGFVDWLKNRLPEIAGQFRENMINGLMTIISTIRRFPGWLWNLLVETLRNSIGILTTIGSWLWTTITGFMRDPLGTLKNLGSWLWDTITGALNNIGTWLSGIGTWLWNTITGAISRTISNVFWGWTGHQTGLNYVPATGLYYLHRGEKVISQPRAQNSNRTIVYRPSFNITMPSTSQNFDVESMVRRVGRLAEIDMRKRGII